MKKTTLHISIIVSTLVLSGIMVYAHYLPASDGGGGQAVSGSASLRPLPVRLPRPMFTSTPMNLSGIPNLERPYGRPRPAFLAPIGTLNVAAGKPVTGSDHQPAIGEYAMVTDGAKEAIEANLVSLAPSPRPQYITIDLGNPHTLYAILFWHDHRRTNVYTDVIVQVSNDPDFVYATTVFNNDEDNSAGFGLGSDKRYVETFEGKLVDARGLDARYVRLYSHGNHLNDLNQYTEVEVFGRPVVPDTVSDGTIQ